MKHTILRCQGQGRHSVQLNTSLHLKSQAAASVSGLSCSIELPLKSATQCRPAFLVVSAGINLFDNS